MTPPDDAEVAIEGEAKVANGIQVSIAHMTPDAGPCLR